MMSDANTMISFAERTLIKFFSMFLFI
jgi:hypothetical protein